MASNIEIHEEDEDEEEDDEPTYANVETRTRTARHKHPRRRNRPVRRGRRYRLVGLGLGLLCGVQALLNIGLRLSLYSDLIEENNNLTKDLDQMTNQKDQCQSRYNNVTAQRGQIQSGYDHLQSKYNNLNKDLDQMTNQKDDLQSRYNNLNKDLDQMTNQKDDLQSRYNNVTAERDELKRRLCELSGWKTFGSSCYYISTEAKTWEESRQYCRDNQSDLIIINSKEEQDFVTRTVRQNQYVWLGLTDREEEGVWKWVDGTPLTSPTYWIHGEPNDAGGGEDCAAHHNGGPGLNGWNDVPCTWTERFVCEKVV